MTRPEQATARSEAMPDRDEMTPGEIARSLKRLEQGLAELRSDIKNLDVIHRAEYEADKRGDDNRHHALSKDVKEIQDDLKTNRRLVLTSLVAPILLVVFGVIFAAAMAAP